MSPNPLPALLVALLSVTPSAQLTGLVHTRGAVTLARSEYSYDLVGNRLTRTDLDGLHRFGYDALARPRRRL